MSGRFGRDAAEAAEAEAELCRPRCGPRGEGVHT
ncbi:MAG: hypothetical protein QOD10_1347 [Mycobacterium sp.]|jgi:hypothetical protein|nr:hypothetical protein [Mycobacterium sp.]